MGATVECTVRSGSVSTSVDFRPFQTAWPADLLARISSVSESSTTTTGHPHRRPSHSFYLPGGLQRACPFPLKRWPGHDGSHHVVFASKHAVSKTQLRCEGYSRS